MSDNQRMGQEMIDRIVKMRQSPEYLMYRLMQARAVPAADKLDSLDVAALREVLAKKASSHEQRMTELAQAIAMVPSKDESPDARYYRGSAKLMALQALETTAEVSMDAMELDYTARTFMEQRKAMLKLARNPFLAEETMIRIANSPIYKGDTNLGRALASNQALTPKAARVLAQNFSHDRFVMHELAVNVSKQAKTALNANEYAQVCKELTSSHAPVDFPLAPAIAGVQDSTHLRTLYKQHQARPTLERNLDQSTFHEIAQNPYTPDDVIEDMSQSAPLTTMLGKQASITHDTIARRTAQIQRSNQPEASAPEPGLH